MANKISLTNDYPVITKSNELYQRALELIPSVTQTLAKGPGQWIKGVAPKYLIKGKGSHVWDVDGNEYIDYMMAVGPLSLGYSYTKVDEAIKKQLDVLELKLKQLEEEKKFFIIFFQKIIISRDI